MKKNVWIFNHYAAKMYKNESGRHYAFQSNLMNQGYHSTIFCASTIHNSDENIKSDKQDYLVDKVNGLPFVFIKTPQYEGNRLKRITNMFEFYKKLFPVTKKYAKYFGKPDIIVASSVHPLTLVAGIQIAKKFGVPCICEVRDLWPETIVAYGMLKRDGLLANVLYLGEKWIYKNADAIIMTWEGGQDYIKDKGWNKEIDAGKVNHISNGVAIDTFDHNSNTFEFVDSDLDDNSYKNVVYAGSIRKINNLGVLLDTAKVIQNWGYDDIRFLIFGSGDQKEQLEKRCEAEGIENVVFKGQVQKQYIPSILKKAYINILHNSSTSLDKYGQSQNKLFEYMAAGRCIIQTYTTGYSVLERYNCGINVPVQNAEMIARTIVDVCSNEAGVEHMGENAREASYQFDYATLTDELINVIEGETTKKIK